MAKVLVVDDEPDVLLLCRVNLEYEGYDVIDAGSGEEALDSLDDAAVDLVLLDVMMPGMDGWEVLKAIKSRPATAAIPVIMLTAKAQDRDQIRGWSDGATEYVTKPFNPIALSQTVKRALEPVSEAQREQKRKDMLRKLRLVEH